MEEAAWRSLKCTLISKETSLQKLQIVLPVSLHYGKDKANHKEICKAMV